MKKLGVGSGLLPRVGRGNFEKIDCVYQTLVLFPIHAAEKVEKIVE